MEGIAGRSLGSLRWNGRLCRLRFWFSPGQPAERGGTSKGDDVKNNSAPDAARGDLHGKSALIRPHTYADTRGTFVVRETLPGPRRREIFIRPMNN